MINIPVFKAENTRPHTAANDGPIITLFVRYRQCKNRSPGIGPRRAMRTEQTRSNAGETAVFGGAGLAQGVEGLEEFGYPFGLGAFECLG